MTTQTIFIAAGGTGGHMFPAEAIATDLLKQNQSVHLLTDMRGLRYADDFKDCNIFQIASSNIYNAGLLNKLKSVIALFKGIVQTIHYARKHKPKAIIGFGGYPSFPAIIAAFILRIPLYLHEQNAILGRANRMGKIFAKAIATSFSPTKYLENYKNIHYIGLPLRLPFNTLLDQGFVYKVPSKNDTIHILIFGGSQGASIMGDIVPKAIFMLPESLKEKLVITQQVREENIQYVENFYKSIGIKAHIAPFIKDIATEMSKAHLMIARSGASTIAEIAACGLPSILVPLPTAMDDQQTYNALFLSDEGGSFHLPQARFTPEILTKIIVDLLSDLNALQDMSTKARLKAKLNAAEDFTKVILS
jgi:UDP-N-acetylglucosamine--N-acetylmuramyl-(pentapeptide) pyrophosphoryl-undecaprenol N-acetylglucosamine transferase